MSKFKSILDHIGHALVDVFKVGTTIAAVAQPFIAAAFPQVAPLYTSALNEAIQVQALATAAGAGPGSGPQKLAIAFTNIEPTIKQFFSQNNMPYDQATASKWLSAVVDTINLLPAPVAPAQISAPAVPAAA